MINTPLVSIVIPIFNSEKYINRCVNSVINQSYKNIEILLINDGSTDQSSILCDNLLKVDNRVRVYHQNNQGLSVARNVGISNSNGEYISFIDSDDWVSVFFIEKLLECSIKYDSSISICNYSEVHESNIFDESLNYTNYNVKIFSSFQAMDLLIGEMNEQFTISCNKLYKRDVFINNSFPPGRYHEDEFTTYKLFLSSNRIAYIDLSMYFYFINYNGITKSPYSSKKKTDACIALLERAKVLKELGRDKLAERSYFSLLFLIRETIRLDRSFYISQSEFKEEIESSFLHQDLSFILKFMFWLLNNNMFLFDFLTKIYLETRKLRRHD